MRKLLHLLIGTFIATLLLFSISFANDTRGLIIEGRTLVPVRGVFEELGFNVIWDAETQTAFLADSNYTVKIQKGAGTFTTNTKIITPEIPQQVISDSFYLPLRAIADSIGAETEWDNDNKIAIIHYNDKTAFVFCGNVTSNEYFSHNDLNSDNVESSAGSGETTTETTTAEISEPQSIREISVDIDEDQNLLVSFLPDDVNDYTNTSEQLNIYMYNKLNELVYSSTNQGISISNNSDYIDFEIRKDNLNSKIASGDLKSYTNCTIKIEIAVNGEIYSTGEYKLGAHFRYNTQFNNSLYDITISCTDSGINTKNEIVARFNIFGKAKTQNTSTLQFVGYDLNNKIVETVPLGVVLSEDFDFEQNYTFSNNTAYICLEEK